MNRNCIEELEKLKGELSTQTLKLNVMNNKYENMKDKHDILAKIRSIEKTYDESMGKEYCDCEKAQIEVLKWVLDTTLETI